MSKKEEIKVNSEAFGSKSVPRGYFRYGNCEICKEVLILPLVPGEDRWSRLVWGIYTIKINSVPKLCWRCKDAYNEVIEAPKISLKREVKNHSTRVSIEDYNKCVELGLIEERTDLV